jgi:Flp pilus assembly pilin Flp
MIKLFKDFLKEEDGLGTVEIVVIIAVLVGIALIFRAAIFSFVRGAVDSIFDQGNAAIDDIDAD